MTLPLPVQRYLNKRAIKGPWSLTPTESGRYRGVVVIPALAEGDSLFATLASLAATPPLWTDRYLVMLVVNHGEAARADVRRQNLLDLERLHAVAADHPLPLAWIDAASPGLELPARQAGVGFARKLGLDTALLTLDWNDDPLLICLDADTLVAPNYFQAIDQHFRQAAEGAAVLPFRHQPADSPQLQAAIDLYELYLRCYVLGLELAGSPYAFHSIGSAMACRGHAYVRCGGMNLRQAAEDFHFLQKLAKTDGITSLRGTKVFPSARTSERVPFGTGRSMTRQLAGDTAAVRFYPTAAFRTLGDWLQLVTQEPGATAEQLMQSARKLSPVLADFLEAAGWQTVWPRLQATHRDNRARRQAFHGWFDGLCTLRLIHHLCDRDLGRDEPQQALKSLFAWAGLDEPVSLADALATLRNREDQPHRARSLEKVGSCVIIERQH